MTLTFNQESQRRELSFTPTREGLCVMAVIPGCEGCAMKSVTVTLGDEDIEKLAAFLHDEVIGVPA